ncbi:MAG: mannonate dehydratase [Bacteroidota bacterium]
MPKKEYTFALSSNMRWFGAKDPVSLADIRQCGAEGVVSALHHIENGKVWEESEIKAYKKLIEARQLKWEVVESLPVHEAIKLGNAEAEKYIENYKLSIRHLAKQGIKVVTYNFMPILDWTRTDLSYRLPSGSHCLYFDYLDLVVFDLFVLEREGAKDSYNDTQIKQAEARFKDLDTAYLHRLSRNVLAGLPGSEEHFDLDSFRHALKTYEELGEASLRKNLYDFIGEIAPFAEKLGIKLAIHPDDPPYSLFGLDRIVSTEADYDLIARASLSPSNGFCFCTGSLGAHPENELIRMMHTHADRIHFLHLRNIKRTAFRSFYEAPHLEGDVDMAAIIETAIQLANSQGLRIPFRPDHGLEILDDQGKKSNPGYTAIGRLKGMAEIRGLELGISSQNIRHQRTQSSLSKN